MRRPLATAVRAVLAPTLCLSLLPALATAPRAALAPSPTPPFVVRAQNEFTIRLYHQLAGDPRANVVVSPFSVYASLAIVAEGARGRTARDLGELLALPASLRRQDAERPWDLAPLRAALATQARSLEAASRASSPREIAEFDSLRAAFAASDARALALRGTGDWEAAIAVQETTAKLAAHVNERARHVHSGSLRVCNAVWSDARCTPPAGFASAVTAAYGPVLKQADFAGAPEAARREINAWVSSRTLDRVPELLGPGDVDALTTLVVANAVAFQGEWTHEFAPRRTREQPFHLAGGDSVPVPLMSQETPLRYGAFRADGRLFATPATYDWREARDESRFYPGPDGFQLVELPYKDSDLALLVLLPGSPSGLPRLEALLTPALLERWITEASLRRTDVELPKFRLDYGGKITGALAALGLARACDPLRAELAGLVECPGAAGRQSIGGVVHRAAIEVDERGTVAVAATAISVRQGAVGREDRLPFVPLFRADRPFLVVIRDRASGALLFIGRCARP